MTPLIGAGSAGVIATLLFGAEHLYPWARAGHGLTGFKAAWLDYPFVVARALIYIALWVAFGRALVRRSRLQDADGDLCHTARNTRLSALFMFVFAVTVWLASYDWLMSIDPHFVSTIFGVYQFAGLFESGLAGMILLSVWLDRQRTEFRLRAAHLHDYGKLLFAFSTFWMYIWFSQYMLVWYSNLAEEAGYFVSRTRGLWGAVFILGMVLNWCVPFAALLPKRPKRNASVLAGIAAVVLAGRYVDLLVAVGPLRSQPGPRFGLIEAGILAGAAGLAWIVFRRALGRAPLLPFNDPRFKGSLQYHS
jgi:hypothetical protein